MAYFVIMGDFMKKFISVLLSVVMIASCVFAFAGCSKNTNAKFDLVLITDGATITDKAYNQSAWNGVKAFGDENDLSYRYYQPSLDENGKLSVETISKYVELAANDGAKYIVLPGDCFAVAAYEIAPTYPEINFVLVDALPHADGDNAIRLTQNVMCVSFDALQAGFLAGYSSVIDGYTKLGYFGSVSAKNSGNYGAGFVQGAAFAADETGTPVMLEYADYDSPRLSYDYSFTIKPVYQKVEDCNEKTFKVNVVDGYGSGVYTDGENVTISAIDAPQGKIFDHWDVKSDTPKVKDKKVNISSKKKSVMNLQVGSCDCTITAVWADATTYPVKIYDANKELYQTLNAPENSTISVTAPVANPGTVFDHWDVDESLVKDVNSATTDLYVTDKDIEMHPVYKVSKNPTFTVIVENSIGSGSYVVDDLINVRANPPEDGYMFYKWESIDNQGLKTGISMENEYAYQTSFKMVDRFSSIIEKMYDDGTQVVFAGGNPISDSVFLATRSFDFPVFAFGSGFDEGSKGNCLASVVNDYGAAVKLCLEDFKGGTILKGDCSNNCIYVTGKSLNADDEAYNEKFANIYAAIADNKITPYYVQSGGDVRQSYQSNCLTLNYWINE